MPPQEAEDRRNEIEKDKQHQQQKWERREADLNKIAIDDDRAKDYVAAEREKIKEEKEEKEKQWERELKNIAIREQTWKDMNS